MTDPEPIVSPAAIPVAITKPYARSALAAMIAGGFIMTISVLISIGYALAPLINGQGWAEFFSFLVVPVIVGIMGLVPGLMLYFTGRQVRKHGAGIGVGSLVIVLAIAPLAFVGLLRTQGFSAILESIALLIIGLYLLFWGAAMIRTARRLRP